MLYERLKIRKLFASKWFAIFDIPKSYFDDLSVPDDDLGPGLTLKRQPVRAAFFVVAGTKRHTIHRLKGVWVGVSRMLPSQALDPEREIVVFDPLHSMVISNRFKHNVEMGANRIKKTPIDEGLIQFKKYVERYSELKEQDLSETDTRSKTLDFLLRDVLGYSEDDITREGHAGSGYFDYEISTANFKFLVEAKRNLADFMMPGSSKRCQIKTLEKGNADVIKQVRQYLIDRGLSSAVISNGHQFIIARFVNTDGTDWRENTAQIFKNLEEVEDRFIEFYNMLSREAVLHSGRLPIDMGFEVQGATILSVLPDKDMELVRNAFSAQLIPIVNTFFSETSKLLEMGKTELLKECYCDTEDARKNNSELERLFLDEPPTFDGRILRARNTQKMRDSLTKEVSGTTRPDPIIIIGGKGVGKSTFITYFFDVDIEEGFRKSRPYIYLDVRDYTQQDVLTSDRIYDEIVSKLIEKYPELKLTERHILEKIFQHDIDQRKKGIWADLKDKAEIERRVGEYLEEITRKSRQYFNGIMKYFEGVIGRRLCIIFDNADQFDESLQKEVFLLAQSIYRSANVLVMISLREGYYYRFRNSPPFDAYVGNVFHIAAAPFYAVLTKRIKHVIKNFEFTSVRGETEGKVLSVGPEGLKSIFENILKSLNKEKSDVLEFLSSVSYPDLRQGLKALSDFLLSGHTNISHYLAPLNSIPPWDFIKSIALVSRRYYSSSDSSIINLFHPEKPNSNLFTRIRLLSYLYDEYTSANNREVYVPAQTIVATFAIAGYSPDIIMRELLFLLNKNLLETNDYRSDVTEPIQLNMEENIRISRSGAYYLKGLLPTFAYMDLVLQDTPIYSRPSFEYILNEFPSVDPLTGRRQLHGRILCVQGFLDYLKSQEKADLERGIRTTIPALKLRIVEDLIEPHVKHTIERFPI